MISRAKRISRIDTRFASASLGAVALALLAFAPAALAGPPTHLRTPALDLLGAAPDPGPTHPAAPFNHACGVAVDSKGDLYLASAGNGVIDVFNTAHQYLASIPDTHQPCGLAVDTTGRLFVSESATGKVVRYTPNAYPFSGTPAYGAPTTIDAGGTAKGISVDRNDDRLYVAEGNHIAMYNPAGTLGIDEVQRVLVTDSVTGGTFKLTFQGQQTAPIAWDATHAQVQAALEALSTIGPGNVSVTQGQFGAKDHIVTFTGALGGADLPLLTSDSSGLTGGGQAGAGAVANGFSGQIGIGDLTAATGVAAYTYASGDRYLFAADAATNQVKLYSGPDVRALKLRRTIGGPKAGENFGFGTAGAYLAVDPGNRGAGEKCASLAEQACTAGHLLVYDDAHDALDEFDASGEFLDQFTDPALADAKPTALAIDRSAGAGDGTIYATAGAGPGAKVLAFGPLAAPSRGPLPAEPPSHVLSKAKRVATDSHGDLYVLTEGLIHLYSPAGDEIEVGPTGHGIEDTNDPGGLAVDSTGIVYVADGNVPGGSDETVTYYTPSQYPPMNGTTYVRHEPAIVTIADLGGGSGLPHVAVKPSDDHLFAAAASGKVFQFDSVANGSKPLGQFAPTLSIAPHATIDVCGITGNVYLGENPGRISVINAAGTEFLARITGAGSPTGKGPFFNPQVAVDQSNCHVLAFDNQAGAAQEYDASGAFVAEFAFPEPQAFSTSVITFGIAIDNACALHRNGLGQPQPLSESTTPTCAEYDPADGRAYIAFDDAKPNTPDLWAFAPLSYGEAPLAATGAADGLGAGGATLHGTVNPRGFELSECRFEYLTDATFLANGKTFTGATPLPCAESLAAIGNGAAPVTVHAGPFALPQGRYRFRLCAKNKYGESCGAPGLFGPPAVTTKSALPVLYREATLRAQIDPAGLPTEYRFQYGPAAGEYDQSTPLGQLPPGDGALAVSADLTGLAEATEYHFRLLAENEAGAFTGPDQTLLTLARRAPETCPNAAYRTGLSAALPDCRAYELVTPAETKGITPIAAGTGEASTGFSNWLVAPRGPGAGGSLAYFAFATLPGFDGNGFFDGYRAQRAPGEHPAEGWSSQLFGPTYLQAVPDYSFQPRQQGLASDQLYSFWTIDPAESLPGTLAKGAYLRTPAGFEPLGQGTLGTDPQALGRYLAPGGNHVIFASKAHLEANAPPSGTTAVYDRAAGAGGAQVVSLKPDGTAFGAGQDATYLAASEDGAAVAFRVGGTLYLRRAGQTVEVAAGPNTFAGLSEDGGRVFYAATTAVTGTGNPLPAKIFACDVQAGPCAGAGAHPPAEIAEESVFVNVSPDGSRVFFSSEAALTGGEENEAGEKALAAQHNLYSWDLETQTARFIARPDPEDFLGFAGLAEMTLDGWAKAINPGGGGFAGRALSPTRATADGGAFVFQSHARLTAYENQGQGEIYRYDPGAAPGERLLCVSCDPSGAPPSADAMLADTGNGVDEKTIVANLSEDGSEVFFQSPDRLLPEDANGARDVYRWQADGAGLCGRPGGCLALISSGQGEADSTIYSISADGRDVFFRTGEKLVGQDVSGSPSIYDARVEGGIPDPPPPAPCQGDACQGQGSEAPVLPAPTSSGPGGGNEPSTPCAKGRHRVRGRCVKKHRKHQRHHHRANRDRRAGR